MIIDTVITIQEHRLKSLLADGLRQAQQTGRPTLVSMVLRAPHVDPLAFFERGARLDDARSFWSAPGAECTIAGVGTAWTLSALGSDRFTTIAREWRTLCAGALVENPFGMIGAGPIVMGGFSFDPLSPRAAQWQAYPDGLLVLPRYILTKSSGSTLLTLNTVVEPASSLAAEMERALQVYDLFDVEEFVPALASSDQLIRSEDRPAAETWKSIVREVEQQLRGGELGKVVLARQYHVQGRQIFDPAQVLARLRVTYADCFVFAVARGDQCFLGASPERLVRLRHSNVRATCLAGSIARGATPEQDRQLGEELLASDKERAEHAFVVRAICDELVELCDGRISTGPLSLMKLRNIQHLFTPIVGRVESGRNILDLVERLHPTPAMGGTPREPALEMIRRYEGMDRGWYASPVGWMDAYGEGEFAVAIRSALLRGSTAALFAGCGIVAGSDPEREYAESCLKLRPMLSVLGANG